MNAKNFTHPPLKINETFHPNYRIIVSYQPLNRQVLFGEANMNHIQIVKIHDVEDGEIYTAKIQKSTLRKIELLLENPRHPSLYLKKAGRLGQHESVSNIVFWRVKKQEL